MTPATVAKPPKTGTFNVQAFLESARVATTILNFKTKGTIISQGDICKDVMYIQTGHVKLSVVSKSGKEAIVAILKPGDFLGIGVLAGQSKHTSTAKAATPATLLLVGLKEMIRVLRAERHVSTSLRPVVMEFSEHFHLG